jgi:hypothetical protein
MTTLKFSSINVGDKLPNMDIDINVSFIVAGAVASRDFTPVHHNKAPPMHRASLTFFLTS